MLGRRDVRVAVIGAGPAGSACALALARRGFDVTLLEAAAFPRHKVCGEYVSPAGTDALERVADAGLLRAAGAQRVTDLAIEVGDRAVEWRAPRPAWALSRAALDTLLLERARAAGARVLQPARAVSVSVDDAGARVALRSGEVLEADLVVHADGRGRLDGGRGATPSRGGVVGLKRLYRPHAPVRGVRMRAAPGAYIGTVQVEGALATCSLVARAALVRRFAGDHDAMLRSLWPAWDPARAVGEWLACGVPGGPWRRASHPRAFRVGNAAGAVEPVGGEGIGLALRSGLLLGETLEPGDLPRTHAGLERFHAAAIARRRSVCLATAWALMRPRLVGGAWCAARRPGLTLQPWWRLSGKAD